MCNENKSKQPLLFLELHYIEVKPKTSQNNQILVATIRNGGPTKKSGNSGKESTNISAKWKFIIHLKKKKPRQCYQILNHQLIIEDKNY